MSKIVVDAARAGRAKKIRNLLVPIFQRLGRLLLIKLFCRQKNATGACDLVFERF